MTAQAKWVINCVAETRGRYGLNIVLGTLMGANRARIRELGTNNYKSYGALKEYTEDEIRDLIMLLIDDGYLIQTEGRYSVIKIGNGIERLRDDSNRIVVRRYDEKEPERKKQTGAKRKKTDELTSEGYDLFEKLRALRLEIAREESMPPYIIFSDKTLIDMCVKKPANKEEMLNVSGVGEHKFAKYGERFIEAICKIK